MPFRKPVPTLGGLNFWENIKQDMNFVLQEHKTGVWPYKYRIIMRSNSKEIANANDLTTIQFDWDFLQENAVPRATEKGFLDIEKLLEIIVSNVAAKNLQN